MVTGRFFIMENNLHELAGDVDFRALVESLDLAIVALDSDWNVLYYNHRASSYFEDSNAIGRMFWSALTPDILESLGNAYKKALLGNHNQLDITDESPGTHKANPEVFSDLPLDLLEQKQVSFRFHSESKHKSYFARLNFQNGNVLFRIEDITDRVRAHRQAERNRKDLQDALEGMKEARNANPLTGLPGNIRIDKELKKRLDSSDDFALVYADLDHFKPFNDQYGFDRGDEAIILVRDLMRTTLNEVDSKDNFLGHIGGDDFVAILEISKAESFCRAVIDRFDSQIQSLYDAEDCSDGEISTTNREGEEERFNMMSITLAVVTSKDKSFENYLEMTETAAEVKKFAKQNRQESNFVINRRRSD